MVVVEAANESIVHAITRMLHYCTEKELTALMVIVAGMTAKYSTKRE